MKPTRSKDETGDESAPPALSVVIPSVNGPGDLVGCLEALEAQRKDVDLDVVVVDRIGERVLAVVKSRFPWATLVLVDGATTIPEMRAVGIRTSRSAAVGILEDHVLVRPGWARQMLDAVAKGAHVVGGAVENGATETVTDWAAFLCEYSHCLPPLPSGEVDWVTGNNVVYTREILQRHERVIDLYKWENCLHEAIRNAGTPLVCHPEIVVDHKKHFTVWEYLVLRYYYSRSYAGARVAGLPFARRLLFGLGALALPPVLFFRTVRRIMSKGRHRVWLLRSLPLLGIFTLAWAWGEVVGSWLGSGRSLSRVT